MASFYLTELFYITKHCLGFIRKVRTLRLSSLSNLYNLIRHIVDSINPKDGTTDTKTHRKLRQPVKTNWPLTLSGDPSRTFHLQPTPSWNTTLPSLGLVVVRRPRSLVLEGRFLLTSPVHQTTDGGKVPTSLTQESLYRIVLLPSRLCIWRLKLFEKGVIVGRRNNTRTLASRNSVKRTLRGVSRTQDPIYLCNVHCHVGEEVTPLEDVQNRRASESKGDILPPVVQT